MHFLFVSHYFLPEELPIAFLVKELAEALATRGHDVHVLTGVPNWPSGKVLDGFHPYRKSIRKEGGVTVHRLPFLPSPNGSFASRALDIVSFRLAVSHYNRTLPRPDLVCVPVPPNEDALAASIIAERFRCPLAVNVQDLQPDCAEALGYIRNPYLLRYLRHQEKAMYERADLVLAIGEGFRDKIAAKGIHRERIAVFPNWIDTSAITPGPHQNPLRLEWEIPAEEFVVLYAGTFGRIHNTPMILDAALQLNDLPGIRFVFVGQGYEFEMVRRKAEAEGGGKVIVRPLVARSRLSELQSLANVSIVSMRKGFGSFSVPSKVLGYMSAGRGVLATIDDDCDTANLIRTARCGEVLPPDNASILAERIRDLASNPYICREWGRLARCHVVDNLDTSVVLSSGIGILERAARGGAG